MPVRMRLILLATVATLFGFAPTGLVAMGLALAAWRRGRNTPAGREIRRKALVWSLVSVAIGIAVETPVLVSLALTGWR